MEIIISGVIVAILVGLDQLTKFLAELFLKASDSIVIIDNIIELTVSTDDETLVTSILNSIQESYSKNNEK